MVTTLAGQHTKEAWGSAGDDLFENLAGLLSNSTSLNEYFASEVRLCLAPKTCPCIVPRTVNCQEGKYLCALAALWKYS